MERIIELSRTAQGKTRIDFVQRNGYGRAHVQHSLYWYSSLTLNMLKSWVHLWEITDKAPVEAMQVHSDVE